MLLALLCVQLYNGEVVACKEIDLEESTEMQEVRQIAAFTAASAAAAAVAALLPLLLSIHWLLRIPLQLRCHPVPLPADSVPPRPSHCQAFVTEATRLHSLRHPNVIAFYGISIKEGKGLVIMEFAEGAGVLASSVVEPCRRSV